jgi:L-amino acid N-acyltransferase YncA
MPRADRSSDVAHIRLATADDLSAILAISNHYALTTAANFAVEPEPLAMWQDTWRATNEMHPWLVAEGERHQGTKAASHQGSEAPRGQGITASRPQMVESGVTAPDTSTTSASIPRSLDASMPSCTILGFAKSSPWKGRCAYHWTAETSVYLRPECHGRGLGRALYDRLIDVMRAQGWRTLLGGITQPNDASVRLHEACGFRKVALLERVGWKFDRWWDVGYWELHLRDTAAPPAPIRPVREVVLSALA